MKEMVEWIKATSDIMVRVLLGQEENLPLLKDFINAVLKDRGVVPVKDLTIKNPITMRTVFNEKEAVLDVKATDETGRILDVEIQSRYEKQFPYRSLYYWAKLYSGQLEKGNMYGKLNPVICINLLDFTLSDLPGTEYHSSYMITKTDDPDILLSDHLRIHFIELPKIIVDPSVMPSDRLMRWMYYFKEEGILEDDEMKIIIKDDPIFEQAHDTFKRFTADEELRHRYLAREMWQRDQAQHRANVMEEGREEGRKEGIQIGEERGEARGEKKSALKIAASLKQNNVPAEIICKTTGLSAEEVEAL